MNTFLQFFGQTIDNLEDLIDATFFVEILQSNEPFEKVIKILNILPATVSMEICYKLLKQLKTIPHHQCVVDYLLTTTDSKNVVLKNLQISLKILSTLSFEELDQFWCLITSPLNILEVLVMNTKLDRLGVALESIKEDLKQDEVICMDDIDEMLRCYAEKSLDFRVVLQPTKSTETKLLESFDSVNLNIERKKFIMPVKVPTKAEWVSNYEVIFCDNCIVVS